MSAWLDGLARDTSPAAISVKVARARPPQAVDGCWDQDSRRTDEPFVLNGPGKCNALYPTHSNPHLAAGGPLGGDMLKCQLKALSRANYPGIAFTDDEWRQLLEVFRGGVCDYSKPGVNQGCLAGTYLSLPVARSASAR